MRNIIEKLASSVKRHVNFIRFLLMANIMIGIIGFISFLFCWDIYANNVANFLLGVASMAGLTVLLIIQHVVSFFRK